MELPPQALPADDRVVIHGVVVVGKRGMGTLVHVCGVVKVIPFPVRHDGDLTDHTQKSGSVMLQPPIPVNPKKNINKCTENVKYQRLLQC